MSDNPTTFMAHDTQPASGITPAQDAKAAVGRAEPEAAAGAAFIREEAEPLPELSDAVLLALLGMC